MASLYTKNGVPLTVSGGAIFNPDGEHFGQLQGDRVYDLGGEYRGSIVDGRLVYLSTDSAAIGGVSAQFAQTAGSAEAHVAGSAMMGDEPNIRP